MNQKQAMEFLTKGLLAIKQNGGSPFNFIENGVHFTDANFDAALDEILENNYYTALTAMGFDGSHAESEFDTALENLFATL